MEFIEFHCHLTPLCNRQNLHNEAVLQQLFFPLYVTVVCVAVFYFLEEKEKALNKKSIMFTR